VAFVAQPLALPMKNAKPLNTSEIAEVFSCAQSINALPYVSFFLPFDILLFLNGSAINLLLRSEINHF